MDNSTESKSKDTASIDNNKSNNDNNSHSSTWDKQSCLDKIEKCVNEIRKYIWCLKVFPERVSSKELQEHVYRKSLEIHDKISELYCFDEIPEKDFNIFINFHNEFEDELSLYEEDDIYVKYRVIVCQSYLCCIDSLIFEKYDKYEQEDVVAVDKTGTKITTEDVKQAAKEIEEEKEESEKWKRILHNDCD